MEPRGWDKASSGAHRRCKEDGMKNPCFTYEEPNLMWQGNKWRVPSATEKELLFGFPADWTRVKRKEKEQMPENTRNAMLGNSWHVPSFRLLFLSLESFCGVAGADLAQSIYHVAGTEESSAQRFFGLMGREFVEAYLKEIPQPL